MPHERDPDRPIIERPCTYEIVGFAYCRSLTGEFEADIDLTLEREGTTRRLRFLGPQSLTINTGFPYSGGLSIIDVSQRQLENLNVWVYNFESAGGCPQFYSPFHNLKSGLSRFLPGARTAASAKAAEQAATAGRASPLLLPAPTRGGARFRRRLAGFGGHVARFAPGYVLSRLRRLMRL